MAVTALSSESLSFLSWASVEMRRLWIRWDFPIYVLKHRTISKSWEADFRRTSSKTLGRHQWTRCVELLQTLWYPAI